MRLTNPHFISLSGNASMFEGGMRRMTKGINPKKKKTRKSTKKSRRQQRKQKKTEVFYFI